MEAILAERKSDYISRDCKQYKNWQELLRYGLAGGLSFVVDFGLLYVLREYICTGYAGVYWAAFGGFLGGLAINTFLSVRYVFRAPTVVADRRGRNVRDVAGIMLVGVAVDALLYFEKDMFDATVFWVIVAVANLLVLSSIIALITFSTKGKKKKKVVSDQISSVAAKENDLFKEAFPDTDPLAALNDSKKSASQRKRNYDDAEWFDFDKKYGFDVMFADFKTYCKERGFVLSDNTVRSTLSAIASSRIIVVDADEKTFHNFVVLASGYFGTRPYFDVVNPTLIKSKMLKTDKDGAQVGSGFASACMSAKNKGKTVFYMLKNVDFANTAYLNDLCESAKHARKRDTSGSTGCAVTENLRVCIRKNGWCVPSCKSERARSSRNRVHRRVRNQNYAQSARLSSTRLHVRFRGEKLCHARGQMEETRQGRERNCRIR